MTDDDCPHSPTWNTTNHTTNVHIPVPWTVTIGLLAAFVLGVICRHFIGG